MDWSLVVSAAVTHGHWSSSWWPPTSATRSHSVHQKGGLIGAVHDSEWTAAPVEGALTTTVLYNPSLHADSALAWAEVALDVAAVRPIAGWTLEVSTAVTHGHWSSSM